MNWTHAHRSLWVLTLALSFVLALPARGQDAELAVGESAPAFEAPADDGQIWRSEDHIGKKLVVVYFYPAAMTGGCTKQACSFRDDRTKLTEMGAEVVAVSGDRLGNLQVFKKANRLNFPLLSDSTGVIAKAFGVPVKDGGTITQEVEGREVTLTRDVTAARWTFIIGLDGKIAYKNTEVDAANDSKAVMAAIQQMQKG